MEFWEICEKISLSHVLVFFMVHRLKDSLFFELGPVGFMAHVITFIDVSP